MAESIKFGDVFRYREKEYIFLAKTVELIYVCQILDETNTQKINSLYEKISKHDDDCKNRPAFCYIILQTKEFKDRMAHLGKDTEKDEFGLDFDKMGIILDKKDLEAIKKEIENSKSPTPLGLKELIHNIDI